ncbi:hypothetical protein [Planomicrobium okeanokoites]|uniref:hypothetical protein n=1 Tax=Planomicrobium okeanokoites TaxID=244 RepID=UPI00248FB31D|nr:hypothetical protein [Planomicrobium okeanokoites]
MFRKLMILLFVLFFMAMIIFTAVMFLTNEETIYDEDGATLAIKKPTFITLSEPEISEQDTDKIAVREMTFVGLDVGTYTMTERTLDNGVTIIFDELHNSGWLPFAVTLIHKGLENPEINSWNPRPASNETDDIFGEDPTSNPFGTIAAGGKHFLQGNLYVSRIIPQGEDGEAYELRTENPNFTIEEGVMEKSFWLPPKHYLHTWLMIADEPFFEDKETEDEWIEFALDNRYQQLNWLTPDGPLVKLPITDDPRTQLSYGYIEERTADPASQEWNETSPSLYFETMLLNAEASQN